MKRLALLVLLAAVGCETIRLGTALGPEVPSTSAPAPPLDVAWDRDVDAGFGADAAFLTDDHLVVGTRQGDAVVLDLETGRPVGSAKLGDAIETRPDLSATGARLFAPIGAGKTGVVAVDLKTGATAWAWRGGPAASLRLIGETVVVLARDGRRLGLDAGTGAERWSVPAAGAAQYQTRPAALGPDVALADDRGRVARIDAASGAERWAAEAGGPVYTTPTASGGLVVVTTTRGRVLALDAETGATRWQADLNDAVRLTSAAVDGGLVAVGGTDGTVLVLDAATGQERWRVRLDGAVSARPLWAGDVLYVGTQTRTLLALSRATGETVWSTQTRGRIKSALLAADGALVALVEPRHVVAYRPVAR